VTSQTIQTELDRLKADVAPTLRLIQSLERDLVKAKSLEFIAVNAIKRADVESSDGHGTYFLTVWDFAAWLRTNSKKRWAEWNTVIYHTSDLINGRMPDMPARMDDLT
jgi:hypothetical protein